MEDLLTGLQNLFTLAFVVSSMLSMGLSLTVPQIIAPLRNPRLVIMALVANFIIVPAAAYILSRVIPMDQELQIGLILFGCAAGAPFLPKLAQIARANVAFAVGLMTLLMVVTVVYLPIVLPLLLPGVAVDAAAIAIALLWQMLLPLGIGLFIRARYQEAAASLLPHIAPIGNISLVLLLVLMLGTNISEVLGLLGSGAILAMVLMVVVAVVTGYFLGGPATDNKRVLALGTGQRNLAAAFVVAGGNFAVQPEVLIFLTAAGLVGMIILFPVAAEFGKRSGSGETQSAATATAAR